MGHALRADGPAENPASAARAPTLPFRIQTRERIQTLDTRDVVVGEDPIARMPAGAAQHVPICLKPRGGIETTSTIRTQSVKHTTSLMPAQFNGNERIRLHHLRTHDVTPTESIHGMVEELVDDLHHSKLECEVLWKCGPMRATFDLNECELHALLVDLGDSPDDMVPDGRSYVGQVAGWDGDHVPLQARSARHGGNDAPFRPKRPLPRGQIRITRDECAGCDEGGNGGHDCHVEIARKRCGVLTGGALEPIGSVDLFDPPAREGCR